MHKTDIKVRTMFLENQTTAWKTGTPCEFWTRSVLNNWRKHF